MEDGLKILERSSVTTYSEAEVRGLLAADNFKSFLKRKCGHCGVVAMKRFAKTRAGSVKHV